MYPSARDVSRSHVPRGAPHHRPRRQVAGRRRAGSGSRGVDHEVTYPTSSSETSRSSAPLLSHRTRPPQRGSRVLTQKGGGWAIGGVLRCGIFRPVDGLAAIACCALPFFGTAGNQGLGVAGAGASHVPKAVGQGRNARAPLRPRLSIPYIPVASYGHRERSERSGKSWARTSNDSFTVGSFWPA